MTSIPNKGRLISDRWLIGATLAAVIALCWGWIVPMALDMYGPMTGCSAWMMTRTWDFTHQALLFAMWAVMMIGMMLPSAAPAVFLYASTVRGSAESARVLSRTFAFAVGYLTLWMIFSLIATTLQLGLTKASLLSPMMELRSRWLGGGLVLIAGAYQFTPWKRKCLECCQSSADHAGPFQAGMRNGISCLGSCWALMLLLFVGGVMNLWWLSALTIFVALEKVALHWSHAPRLPSKRVHFHALYTLWHSYDLSRTSRRGRD
jgi:predicted metal-binding membrane protein